MSDGQRDASEGLRSFLLGRFRSIRESQLVFKSVNNQDGEPVEPDKLSKQDLAKARGSLNDE